MSLICRVRKGGSFLPAGAVRLCMSVGHPAFEGDSLATLLHWCKANSQNQFIVLADTLQRFNLHGTYPYAEALTQARVAGDEWLERNLGVLDRMGMREKFSRWESWRTRDGFVAVHDEILSLYESVPAFREAVTKDARAFLARRQSTAPRITIREHIGSEYILEEVAFCEFFERQNDAVEVYPGGEPFALRQARSTEELSSLAISRLRKVELRVVDGCDASPE